jgi:putative DNA primase/helicase
MTTAEIAQHFKATKSGTGWIARCPSHDDKEPSLSITEGDAGRTLVYCHAGCTFEQIVSASGLKVEDFFPCALTKVPPPPLKPLTIQELAAAKGLPTEFLQSVGVEQAGPGVRITYRMMDGSLAARHQIRHANSKAFWSGPQGSPLPGPYGMERLHAARGEGFVLMVEGASDTWTGWYHHVPTLGFPGANTPTKLLLKEHVAGIAKIYVLKEPGAGGAAFVAAIEAKLLGLEYQGMAFALDMPEGLKDLNELHLAYPDVAAFAQHLQGALDLAVPLNADVLDIEIAKPLKDFFLTPVGDSERLLYHHDKNFAYTNEGGFYDWTGLRWKCDTGEHRVIRRATRVMRGLIEYSLTLIEDAAAALLAAGADDAAKTAASQKLTSAKALYRWAMDGETRGRISQMLHFARGAVLHDAAAFDTKPLLLNVANGTIDLTTGTLRAAARDDKLTLASPATYDAVAACPTFERFVSDIMAGDGEMIAFLQRLMGLLLTGDNRDQLFVILHGTGENGKSTWLEIVRALLGQEYSRVIPSHVLMAHKSEGGASPEISRLKGARLVTSVEPEKGQKLAEAFVKAQSGGDMMTGRSLYKDYIEFVATHKIILATNHRPRITGTDHAIWRRIVPVPFEVSFKGRADLTMGATLKTELSGILNWALAGTRAWLAEGLQVPEKIALYAKEYRETEDRMSGSFDAFMAARGVFKPSASVIARDVYPAYLAWCLEEAAEPATKRALSDFLSDKGIKSHQKKTEGVNNRWYRGFALTVEVAEVTKVAEVTREGKVSTGESPSPSSPYSPVKTFTTEVTPVTISYPLAALDTTTGWYRVVLRGLANLHTRADCRTSGCTLHDVAPIQEPCLRRSLRRATAPEMVERLARAFPDGRPAPLPDGVPEEIISPEPVPLKCEKHPVTPRADICAECRTAGNHEETQ